MGNDFSGERPRAETMTAGELVGLIQQSSIDSPAEFIPVCRGLCRLCLHESEETEADAGPFPSRDAAVEGGAVEFVLTHLAFANDPDGPAMWHSASVCSEAFAALAYLVRPTGHHLSTSASAQQRAMADDHSRSTIVTALKHNLTNRKTAEMGCRLLRSLCYRGPTQVSQCKRLLNTHIHVLSNRVGRVESRDGLEAARGLQLCAGGRRRERGSGGLSRRQ